MIHKKLGIGIIGCGSISKSHIEGCRRLTEECEIKAVADIDHSKAQRAAQDIGLDVTAYDDYNDILNRDDIDVVSICTPPFAHKSPAIAALEAGKHVLVEKPMASSLEECDEMIRAAETSGCKLGVVFQLRFQDEFNRMRQVLSSEEMGQIVFSQMNGYYWRGPNYYNIPWRGKFDTESGGVTMNHSIHTLDLFLWLMNAKPVSVWGDMHTIGHDIEVEDLSMAVIGFENGAVGQVNCSLNSVKQEHTMSFSSKTRYISYPLDFHALKDTPSGFPTADKEGVNLLRNIAVQAKSGKDVHHSSTYQNLFSAIQEDSEPLVNGLEGRKTIELITAIYKSASTEKKVLLPIEKDDPWYTREGILREVKRSSQGTKET